MKSYWDSSVLVEAVTNPQLATRLETEHGFSRPHALAETFATLTGNPTNRIDADSATAILERMARWLDFVDFSGAEVLTALKTARAKGVRGGRVHDYLHAVAAEKSGAKNILTLDKNDFADLTRLEIEQA
jgi:predicted nucleic acid-binding protein